MPAEDEKGINEKSSSSSTTFGSFFPISIPRGNRLLLDLQLQSAITDTERDLQNYQQTIKNYQTTINNIKNLLTKNTLSDSAKSLATTKLQSLETNLQQHEAKFASLVASNPVLQTRFILFSP